MDWVGKVLEGQWGTIFNKCLPLFSCHTQLSLGLTSAFQLRRPELQRPCTCISAALYEELVLAFLFNFVDLLLTRCIDMRLVHELVITLLSIQVT